MSCPQIDSYTLQRARMAVSDASAVCTDAAQRGVTGAEVAAAAASVVRTNAARCGVAGAAVVGRPVG